MTEMMLLQAAIVAIAFGVPIFLRGTRTPLSLLLDSVATVVNGTWMQLRSRDDADISVDPSLLSKADQHLSRRRKVLAEEERQRRLDRQEKFYTRHKREAEETHRSAADVVGTVLAFLVFGALVAGVFIGIPAAVYYLIRTEPYRFVVGMLFAALMLLVIRVAEKYLPPRPETSLVFATGSVWRSFQASSTEKCDTDRQLIARMTAAGADSGSAQPLGGARPDPDLAENSPSQLPMQPGITEIAMEYNEDAIVQIKAHLWRTRTFHLAVATSAFAVFLLAVVFVLYSTVYLEKGSFASTFGGVGLGAVLGTFCYLAASRTRVAQIALALFESYVAELRLNLHEAEACHDLVERRSMRSDAWQSFRIGLNGLWTLEQQLQEAQKKGDVQKEATE